MLDDIRPLVRLGVNIAVKKMIKWKLVLMAPEVDMIMM